MKQTRFEQGMEQLGKIDGVGGEAVIRSLEDIAPDVGRCVRRNLSPRRLVLTGTGAYHNYKPVDCGRL